MNSQLGMGIASSETGPRRHWGGGLPHLLARVVQHGILILGSIGALFPLWFMVWTAVREQNEYLQAPVGWPAQFHFDNFTRAVSEDVGRWILNSVIVTGGSVILVSIVALMAAYAIVRLPFPGSRILLRVIVALMVVPPVLMLIPMFLMMVTLGRVSHFDSVIVVYAGLMFPFSVYMLVSFIETIPAELYEAAVIDGASHFRIMWSIVVPLTRPALVTLATVNALWAWNELIVAVVMLQNPDSRTLQAGLALLKGKHTIDVPLVMAGATISVIPILMLYLFGQRHFRRGLLAGAIKE